MKLYRALYRWLAVPIHVRGIEYCGTDFFGLGMLCGAVLGLWVLGGVL